MCGQLRNVTAAPLRCSAIAFSLVLECNGQGTMDTIKTVCCCYLPEYIDVATEAGMNMIIVSFSSIGMSI
jgi:hypothetical protein